MNNSGTRRPTGARKLMEVKEKSVNDGVCMGSGPRMDHQSGRLFNDRQILILEINLERDVLRLQRYRIQRAQVDFDGFAAADPVSGFIQAAINANGARTVQQLDLRPREFVQVLCQEDVQAETAIV